MRSPALLALLSGACIVGTLTSLRAQPASAQTPTVTPVAHPAIIIHVINDLNGDGIRQTSEPGMSGWHAYEGCSDALLPLGPTDANGEYRTPYENTEPAAFEKCVHLLQRTFGWLPTSPVSVRTQGHPGGTLEVTFLLRDMGRNAMEVVGEVLVAGLPAQSAKLSIAAPYTSCGGGFIDPSSSYVPGTVIVSGADLRTGCPADGQAVTILVNGAIATTVAFAPGQWGQAALAINGSSMRVVTTNADSATIGGVDCSVTIAVAGSLGQGMVRIFVLSSEVRPGCGTPGQLIRFFSHGQPLDPLVTWEADGIYQAFRPASLATPTAAPGITPTPRTRVIAPDTGTGAASGAALAASGAAIMAAIALATLGTGVILLRRRIVQ